MNLSEVGLFDNYDLAGKFQVLKFQVLLSPSVSRPKLRHALSALMIGLCAITACPSKPGHPPHIQGFLGSKHLTKQGSGTQQPHFGGTSDAEGKKPRLRFDAELSCCEGQKLRAF